MDDFKMEIHLHKSKKYSLNYCTFNLQQKIASCRLAIMPRNIFIVVGHKESNTINLKYFKAAKK